MPIEHVIQLARDLKCHLLACYGPKAAAVAAAAVAAAAAGKKGKAGRGTKKAGKAATGLLDDRKCEGRGQEGWLHVSVWEGGRRAVEEETLSIFIH